MTKWIDLSWNFAPGMPVPLWPGQRQQDFTLESFHMENTGGNQNFIHKNLHCGTHVDAPGHYHPGGASIEKVPLERWVGTCFTADLDRPPLTAIDVKDLEPYEAEFTKADMFFVRTGADTMWGTADYATKYPFFTPEAGEYLIAKGCKLLGMDTPGPDAGLASGFRNGSPLHFTLLGNDCLIVENLANLKLVAGRTTYVMALPVKYEGAYGGPARVVAKELDA
ncbi:cyclase family protein [Aurantimonas sp. A3-2-R12]|uniref:cyclase family protein n=1 Tax=Aurantimonas sp. A3-2-R12 TaxID=3114362 RepID=UPI002E1941D4|nr:cyclase family protein [Aurantimonas sp. A3-2-R12]